jgi:hypothetical protein
MSTQIQNPSIFEALRERRTFIVASKADKVPRDPSTLQPIDAQIQTAWMLPAEALAHVERLGAAYGVGIVLTQDCGLACIDIDGAWDGTQWSALALSLAGAFTGAYVESSVSGKGLHIIFSYSGQFPAHRSKNTELHIELYHEARYILLTGHTVTEGGSVEADYSAFVLPLIAQYFQPRDAAASGEWTSEPVATWHGPSDDDSLIKIALRSKRGLKIKVTFKDLWTANADKLAKVFPAQTGGKEFDASSADLSLANALAFWTGNDCERIERLMRESALVRDKWQRDDYLRGTILSACAGTANWYNDSKGIVPGDTAPTGARVEGGICLDDFHAYLPQHNYIFAPNRELWGAAGVDASVPWPNQQIKPSEWLDKARPVHQMIWAPGREMIVRDKLVASGGWIEKPGSNTFNLYLPPAINPGDPALANPWLALLEYAYPDNAAHIVKWFAHRRQRPQEKVNHALVFGGEFGIGKDSMIEPLKQAVGPWNFGEVAPKHLQGDFNGYYKSVVLRVSEARDTGEVNRYALYETTKTLIATPPDVLRCNEKNLKEHDVFNVMGVIFTTNHKDGLFLPPGDRRHYVMWCERTPADFPEAYWPGLWRWYQAGGFAHVVAYLDSVDLSDFDPKEPPHKTPAYFAMVDAGRAPEDSELADALDKLGNPPAVTLDMVIPHAGNDLRATISDRRTRRQIPHRFEAAGYVPTRNPHDKHDGQWKIGGKRQTVYARKELSERDRLAAATALR